MYRRQPNATDAIFGFYFVIVVVELLVLGFLWWTK